MKAIMSKVVTNVVYNNTQALFLNLGNVRTATNCLDPMR